MPGRESSGHAVPAGQFLRCPEQMLAGEIEFAITYVQACDPQHARDRSWYAEQIALMLLERAGNRLSGMSMEP